MEMQRYLVLCLVLMGIEAVRSQLQEPARTDGEVSGSGESNRQQQDDGATSKVRVARGLPNPNQPFRGPPRVNIELARKIQERRRIMRQNDVLNRPMTDAERIRHEERQRMHHERIERERMQREYQRRMQMERAAMRAELYNANRHYYQMHT